MVKILSLINRRILAKNSTAYITGTSLVKPVVLARNCTAVQQFRRCATAMADDKVESAKRAAARQCVDENVKSGQILGIGTGSTIVHAVERLGELVRAGQLTNVHCVPSSFQARQLINQQGLALSDLERHTKLDLYIERLGELVRAGQLTNVHCVPSSFQARQLINQQGLALSDLERHTKLDLYIDGADEVDQWLNCIKGGGGCLTQEKIVMSEAKVFYIIADYRKRSECLGEKWTTIPLEVVQQAWRPVSLRLSKAMGGEFRLRQATAKAGPVVTDNYNFILDWDFPKGKCHTTDEWNAFNNGSLDL